MTQTETAVDFLTHYLGLDKDSLLYEQAKEMEKKQIIDAYEEGQRAEAKQEFWTKGNKYFTETFKQ